MTSADTPNRDLVAEIEDLRAQLAEAQETLRAIRSGEVDALVVSGPDGDRVYTLKGEDRSYRVLVESVNEGALILTSDGTIMYANSTFARMIGVSLEKIIGVRLDVFVPEPGRAALETLLRDGARHAVRREMHLIRRSTNESLPVYVSIGPMVLDEASALSAVVTDLTEAKRTQRELARHRDHLEDLVRERTAEVQTANEELRVEIEERRQIEEALRESEARLQATLRSSADEIWIVDAQARIALVSDTVTENLGIGSGELEDVFGAIKRLEILTPDGTPRPEEETPLLLSLRGETIRKVEEMIRNVATGELRWREVSSVPIRDYDGIIIGATAVVRDITERKHAEEALRESEARFRIMADGIPQIIWVHDAEGRLQFVNRAYSEFFGVTLDHVHSTGWQALVHPDDYDAYVGEFLNATRERRHYHAEGRVQNARGEWRWIDSHGRPRFSQSGEFQGVAGSSVDITERKQAEQALAESERFFRAVYDSTQDAIVVADDDGRYVSANPAVFDVFGLSQDEMVGRTVGEFMEPGSDFAGFWSKFLQTGMLSEERKLLAADGTARVVESRATANMLPGRHLDVIHDVTGEVMLRDQLQRQVNLLQRALLPPAAEEHTGLCGRLEVYPGLCGQAGDWRRLLRPLHYGIGRARTYDRRCIRQRHRGRRPGRCDAQHRPGLCLRSVLSQRGAQPLECAAGDSAVQPLPVRDGISRAPGPGYRCGPIRQCRPSACAGLGAGGVVRYLNTGSAPLGVLDATKYAEYTAHLDVGDRMVIYTDGISEARKGSALFGTEGIERVLVEHGHEPPDVLVESVLEAAKEFAEGQLRDDTALVVICRS